MFKEFRQKRDPWFWLFPASLVLYFFSRRWLIINRTVMGDDLITANVMQMPWGKFFQHLAIEDNQQVLFYLIQKILWPILPANDYGLRLLPVIFGAGALILLWKYWLKKTKSVWTGFLFSLLFILSPNIINISIFSRPYSLLLLLVCWNLLSLETLYEKGRLSVGFFVSLALIFLTHHLGALYIASLLFFLLIEQWAVVKRHLLQFAAVLIPFGGFFLYKFNQGLHLIDWNNRPGFEVPDKYFSYLFVPFKSHVLLTLFVLILLIPLWKSFKGKKSQELFALKIFFGSLLLYAGVVIFKTKFEATRYYLLVLPPLFFALPLYLERGNLRKAFFAMLFFQLIYISEHAATQGFPREGKAFKHFVFDLDKGGFVPAGSQVLCISPMSFLKEGNPFDYYRTIRKKAPLCSKSLDFKAYVAMDEEELGLFDFAVWDGYDYPIPFDGKGYGRFELLFQKDKLLLFRFKKMK